MFSNCKNNNRQVLLLVDFLCVAYHVAARFMLTLYQDSRICFGSDIKSISSGLTDASFKSPFSPVVVYSAL